MATRDSASMTARSEGDSNGGAIHAASPAAPAVAAPVLVEARDVGRIYGTRASRVVALATATCAVRAGDRIALVGPSGSGKSTLLHLLGGLDAPTSGALTWPALGARDRLRPGKVAFVFQSPSLLPALTATENVALPLLLGGGDPREAYRDAGAILARLDLGDLADKLPEELSGGQAQRVALARALVCRPPLVLADEPTGQLDRATAMHVLDVLLAAIDGMGTALVIATHDMAVAARLPVRWRMEHGVLEGVR